MTAHPIKVLVVDDSEIFVESLVHLLSSDDEIEVVGVARDGAEALSKTSRLEPDIITMDIRMPMVSGLEAIEQIMAFQPTPILVLSDSLSERMSFESLARGALDVIQKPSLISKGTDNCAALAEKLKFLSKIRVVRHMAALNRGPSRPPMATSDAMESRLDSPGGPSAIAFACSTGGPRALMRILSGFPGSLPATILVVQHMSPGFVQGLAGWLDSGCSLDVRVAQDGDPLQPNTVLIAPDGSHMAVEHNLSVSLTNEPPVDGHRPSASVLFSSVGRVFQKRSIGVILTGMGSDGTAGAADIRTFGGTTIAQDKESSLVFGMPGAAIERGVAKYVLGIRAIPHKISQLVNES